MQDIILVVVIIVLSILYIFKKNDKKDVKQQEFIEKEKEFIIMNSDYGYGGRIKEIRKQFPKLDDIVYLDHTSSTLYSSKQMENIQNELNSRIYCNPHSQNPLGIHTRDQIEYIREMILSLFNAPYREYSVVFTSGCTDSLKKVGEYFPWTPTQSTFYYAVESHNSLLGIREYACENQCQFKAIPNLYFKASSNQFTEICDIISESSNTEDQSYNLFAFPAQCNYNGSKYPLELIKRLKSKFKNLKILLDVAALVGTSPLDLTEYRPDFVALSFYKMFGYPTGLGALIIKNDCIGLLKKSYFGGGTVNASLAQERFHVPRDNPIQNLEDGTQSFLNIVSLKWGLEILKDLTMPSIQSHTFSLIRYLYRELSDLCHSNGAPLCQIYTDNHYQSSQGQGATLNLNLLKSDGMIIGFNEVEKIASLNGIFFRTGCFCNPGACHGYLELTKQDVLQQLQDGHVCWDDKDIIDGKPTGSIRLSLGYMSDFSDCWRLVEFLKCHFINDQKNQLLMETKEVMERSTDGEMDSDEITLDEVYVYPVKSCGGFRVTSQWEIVESGLKYDREWTIIDTSGNYLNQKKLPILAQISTVLSVETNQLILSVSEMEPLVIPLDYYPISNSDKIQVCGDKVDGLLYGISDCKVIGADCSQWLYKFTGKTCFLVRKSPTYHRVSRLTSMNTSKSGQQPPAANAGTDSSSSALQSHDTISFANESPFLLISDDSVKDLKERVRHLNPHSLDKWNWISKHSFRANFIVSSHNHKAYQEDNWDLFTIGKSLVFKCIGDCNRCKMICINQKMGIEEKEPLATLSSYRRNKGKIIFGQHLQLISNSSGSDRIFITVPSKINVLSFNNRS
ncbi:molybdenum cofactor sulfurase [Tieghemostelium lacteum]|uniref:Molybdenum cofactor sulfurase n=1 Tax=Tieghemostelium lacteum TaxID=361077 RepID=A0A151ZER0_TIELA|nr:molybdenum cofactor sulfurase [Tieghemostelium lacteum]|eukprot:KYQ92443.1 molybdenum cofactor sulfurase [Tieghemostelium lacteum]